MDTINSNNIEDKNFIVFELGDIIEIISPTNSNYHEKTFIIKYINEEYMEILNINFNELYTLKFSENNYFNDESIIQVNILNRSEEKGFAKQNNLTLNKWINIHFQGDIPVIITGEITDTEDDMIEITTYPEKKIIYIDFAYQGLPNNIPIEKIIIRQKPTSLSVNTLVEPKIDEDMNTKIDEELNDTEISSASMEQTDNNEYIINIPENEQGDENIYEKLNDMYVNSNIIFGEELDEIKQVVEIPENEQRYSLDIQINDLMDQLLSTIPNYQRNKLVMSNIHNLIEKFKHLRKDFSLFDNNNNVYDFKKKQAYYKPLVERILNFDHNIKWFIPVVKQLKMVYQDHIRIVNNDSDYIINLDPAAALIDIQTRYKNNTYNYIHQERLIDEVLNPSTTNNMNNINYDCLATKNVNTNIDTIIDNLGDFYSTVMKYNNIDKEKYVIQRYNLSNKYVKEELLNNGKKIYKRVNFSDNDEICIKSLLMLPKSVINYSKINLPNTNILEKTNLHHTTLMLSKIINNKNEIIPHVIDDLSQEFNYKNLEEETQKHIFSNIHEFTLDSDIREENKYHKFLETIIPKTRSLISMVQKYNTNKMSLYDYVSKLEPFFIYTSDLSYKQYNDIRFYVKEQIQQYKINFEKNYNHFLNIKKTLQSDNELTNNILHLINEKNISITDSFYQNYRILIKNKQIFMNSHETLLQMLKSDNGKLYNTIISSILISLITPENVLSIISEPNIDNDEYKKVSANDCSTRYLSKKYDSINKLTNDNGKELYFDEELDDTPYNILDKYKNEQNSMSNDVFFSFLKENLIQKHNTSKESAEELTKTIIANKKLVKEGDYAILEIKPTLPNKRDEIELNEEEKQNIELEENVRTKRFYYRRFNDNWIKDDDINTIDFIDTNTIFCNLKQNCIKNPTNNICENNNENINRNLDTSKKTLLNEFSKRYSFSVDELNKKLEIDIDTLLKQLKRNNNLNEIRINKYNNIAYELGRSVSDSDVLISPHLYLRDLILGQEDFVKKQTDICLFVENFCRDPLDNLNENQNWKYCIDTNTQLMPNSIYKLANAFILNNDYMSALNNICREYGTLSDDGDSIVDKYSGFILRKIDYSNDEGYDESGFKKTSHDILEQDLGNTIFQSPSTTKKVKIFENETNELIYSILVKISETLDIDHVLVEDFVIKTSNLIIRKKIVSEQRYNEKLEKDKLKNKKEMTTYENYRNEIIILIVSSITLIAIQTSIPTITTKRTVYNCIKSFNGYPLRGIEDLTSVEYIACILSKINTQVSPWNSIKKNKKDKLTTKLKSIIDFMIEQDDIKNLYDIKREYLTIHPDIDIPSKHVISKWKLFNPPLVKYSILKRLQNVSKDFQNTIIENIKSGNNKQHELINVLKVKQREHSYGIMEIINNIIQKNDLLLKTSGSIPFLENACCYENNNSINPMYYFNEQDNNILNMINKIKHNSKLLRDIKLINTAPLFFPNINNYNGPLNIPNGLLMENIYKAIIYYCNFDKDLPVPNYLKSICNNKPENYSSKWSIEEKIAFLKKNGKNYNITDYTKLLKIIYKRNIVNKQENIRFKQIERFADIIDYLDKQDSTLIEPPLIQLLQALISEYNPKSLSTTYSNNLNNLINYLDNVNTNMLKQIMTFFKKFGNNFDDKEYNNIISFLQNIDKWNLEDNDVNNKCHLYNEGLHSFITFIVNSLQALCKIYPTALQNNQDFNIDIPKHWDLNERHKTDLITFNDKYFENLKPFSNDKTIVKLLQLINIKLKDIYNFVLSIPLYTELSTNISTNNENNSYKFHCLFDKKALYLLYTYCIYAVIHEYITTSDDDYILQIELIETKNEKKNEINNQNNESNYTYSDNLLNENTVDNYIDLQEIQIVQGNKNELKTRVCNLLFALLNMEIKNKNMIDITYDDIVKQVTRSREAEKEKIFEYFNNMKPEQREVEDKLKQYKLGRWNIGLSKDIYKYNKETYDKEGFENENAGIIENDNIRDDNINDETNEMYDISNLGTNITDGIYYNEDEDLDDLDDQF